MSHEIRFRSQSEYPFTNIQMQAGVILSGPRNLSCQVNNEPFFGWQVLLLQQRAVEVYKVESRIVYANPVAEHEHSAVLRAVYWNAVSARSAFDREPANYHIAIPARFVILSIDRLRQWISLFGELEIRIAEAPTHDESTSIRRLRIEQDYVSDVFERVWQGNIERNRAINERWDAVWNEMSEHLAGEKRLEAIEESYRPVPSHRYDLAAYRPDLWL